MHDSLHPRSVFAVFPEGAGLRQAGMENCGFIYWIAATSMARILIADDYEAARRGIRRLLEAYPGWEVCGEAADGFGVVLKTATKTGLGHPRSRARHDRWSQCGV